MPKRPAISSAKPAKKVPSKSLAKKPTRPSRSVGASSAPAGRKRTVTPASAKLFVLDTNVLMHDPAALFKFDEHDILIPMIVLEELDAHKSGMSEVSRNVRSVTRLLDQIISRHENGLASGIDLSLPSSGMASGRLFLQHQAESGIIVSGVDMSKGDNQILAVTLRLRQEHPRRDVVLVSKDINIRIKARALGLSAEDYRNDLVLDDSDLLPVGIYQAASSFMSQHGDGMEVEKVKDRALFKLQSSSLPATLSLNTFLSIPDDEILARVVHRDRRSATLRSVANHQSDKGAVMGIKAKNVEQSCALDLLTDPDIDLVMLLGEAGTGKTLLALAAALSQTKITRYSEIIITRATVPLGDDIGFLPGTEEDKISPWMGAFDDNLEVIVRANPELAKNNAAAQLKSLIKIKSMNFMRGRTFLNKFLILDEAQNLTPKQMKALVTRAGPGTKIVCLGNLKQIDTPYLTEGGSGLTYLADRFANWQHAGCIVLSDCVRSRLADYAGGVL